MKNNKEKKMNQLEEIYKVLPKLANQLFELAQFHDDKYSIWVNLETGTFRVSDKKLNTDFLSFFDQTVGGEYNEKLRSLSFILNDSFFSITIDLDHDRFYGTVRDIKVRNSQSDLDWNTFLNAYNNFIYYHKINLQQA